MKGQTWISVNANQPISGIGVPRIRASPRQGWRQGRGMLPGFPAFLICRGGRPSGSGGMYRDQQEPR